MVRGTIIDDNIFKWNVGEYLRFETWHGCGRWSSALFLRVISQKLKVLIGVARGRAGMTRRSQENILDG